MALRIKIKQLFDFLITSPSNGQYLRYNSTSQKWQNVTMPTIWTGQATVTGSTGLFTVNIPAGTFTNPPKVFVTGRGTDTQGGAVYASVTSVTNTTITGRANTSTTVGVLLVYILTNAPAGTVIDVMAIGN